MYPQESTPFGLLAIVTCISLAQTCLLIHTRAVQHAKNALMSVELIAAFSIIAIILQMPLRKPRSRTYQIGSQSKAPSCELRSPEDNLTLWQFMTVSWMSPLISLGSTRQLNDIDVWSLGYEFQHRYLHLAFRQLRGSVTSRLLKANGLDIVIMSVLAVSESLASM